MRRVRLMVVALLGVVLLLMIARLPAGQAAPTRTGLPATHCHIVVRKVHGHKRRIRKCTPVKPTATPAPPPLFDRPSDLAVSANGNVVVADQRGKDVVILSPDGKVLSRWTVAGARPSAFDQLYGLSLDRAGNVYVTDAQNQVLDKLDPAGKPLAQWTTNLAEPQSFPTLLAVAPTGDIFLADHAARAIVHLSSGGALLGVLGRGTIGDPYGVALGPDGNVYVADFGAGLVEEFTLAGTLVASWGDGKAGSVRLSNPEALAIDRQGDVYVTEQSGRIEKFDASGALLADWGQTAKRLLDDPSGIALDAAGNLFVAEYSGNRVDKLSPSGDVLAVWQ